MTIDISELRRLAQAATPGPWIGCGPSFGESLPKYLNEVVVDREGDEDDGYSVCTTPIGLEDQCSDDMAFIAATNPAAISELLDRLEAAEKEIAKLRIALAEKVTSETTLRDLSVGNGSINATFEGGAIQLMVDALATQFVESDASNYIEMQFHSEATGPLVATMQRVDGKTPHQLREAAEKERDALRAKIDQMDGAMESLLIRCDDSDSAMYGTLSTSFVRDAVRIAREALEESK